MRSAKQRKWLLKWADHIEKIPPAHFDMETWIATDDYRRDGYVDPLENDEGVAELQHALKDLAKFRCNSVGCIAGHGAALFRKKLDWDTLTCVEDAIAELVGLDEDEAERLFYNMSLTPKSAAKALRRLAEE